RREDQRRIQDDSFKTRSRRAVSATTRGTTVCNAKPRSGICALRSAILNLSFALRLATPDHPSRPWGRGGNGGKGGAGGADGAVVLQAEGGLVGRPGGAGGVAVEGELQVAVDRIPLAGADRDGPARFVVHGRDRPELRRLVAAVEGHQVVAHPEPLPL